MRAGSPLVSRYFRFLAEPASFRDRTRKRLLSFLFTSQYVLMASVGALSFAGAARADVISLELVTTSVSVAAGDTQIFEGAVTNNSGVDLHASDFSVNFFGYD